MGVMVSEISFKWRHFQKQIVLLAIRWYLAYPLSYRNIEEMMAERQLSVDHTTIYRWVLHYAPLLEEEFRQKYKRAVGVSWRMDETYIKIKGKWHYLYRAVDKEGKTIDFMLSTNRDKESAIQFFRKAIVSQGFPEKVTIDKSGANLAALNEINSQIILWLSMSVMAIQIRQIKYLNNRVEQDHRSIKRIVNPMMGFKAFHSASATLSGIELYHMLRKEQHVDSNKSAAFESFYALAA
jgi:putative transposase